MITRLLLAITILLLSFSIFSKEDAASTKGTNILNPEEKPNYLDQFNNQDVCKKLRILNKEYIYFLDVVTTNFAKDKKSQMEKIKKSYTEALKLFFKTEYTKAAKLFTLNLKEMKALTKEYVSIYKKSSETILNICAEKLSKSELSFGIDANSIIAPGQIRYISSLNHNLRLAFFQVRAAEKFALAGRNRDAIVHYRLAKGYGINLLRKLALDEKDKSKVYQDYKLDLLDNRNKIASEKK